jgi:hypothetical protein
MEEKGKPGPRPGQPAAKADPSLLTYDLRLE